mmetsp:Transcript_25469/g.83870  ORF Transcript_25469/g.83870 Transcript_25469/m.83870 type:complete len:94 (+) Transcript_25469:2-283(+)
MAGRERPEFSARHLLLASLTAQAARPRLDAQHQPIEAGRELRLLLIAAAFLAAAAFDLSTLPPWARWAGLAVAGVYSWRRVYVANGRVLNPPA